MKTDSVIHIEHLFKSFGTNKVLEDFSLDIYKGESLAILGKSGSGKSVLIKCIIGLMQPDKGAIEVLGKNVIKLGHAALDALRVKVGFLFQSNALYDSMTVRENLEFPLRRHGINMDKKQINDLVIEALTNVKLKETVDMMPAELSGGMRKRISLARTLILKPEIILYDEPTTGLDPITGGEINELILEIQKKYDASSVIITHDMDCVKTVSNRIALLVDGQCYKTGTYDEMKRSNDKKIKQYFK